MIENIIKSVTTGTIEGDNKLLFALILNFIFSVIIFIISKIISSLWSEKNILGLKDYKFLWSIFKWSIGSVFVCFLLLICDLITYKIFSLVVVAFTWDTCFSDGRNTITFLFLWRIGSLGVYYIVVYFLKNGCQ